MRLNRFAGAGHRSSRQKPAMGHFATLVSRLRITVTFAVRVSGRRSHGLPRPSHGSTCRHQPGPRLLSRAGSGRGRDAEFAARRRPKPATNPICRPGCKSRTWPASATERLALPIPAIPLPRQSRLPRTSSSGHSKNTAISRICQALEGYCPGSGAALALGASIVFQN